MSEHPSCNTQKQNSLDFVTSSACLKKIFLKARPHFMNGAA